MDRKPKYRVTVRLANGAIYSLGKFGKLVDAQVEATGALLVIPGAVAARVEDRSGTVAAEFALVESGDAPCVSATLH